MDRFLTRRPVRPREPGERPPADPLNRLRPWYVVATTMVVVILATVGLVAIRSVDSSSDAASARRDQADEISALSATAFDARLPLPLTVVSVGFADGDTEDATADQGPGAVGVCGQRPAVEGLQAWRANRLTDSEQRRRVGQLLARFRSSTQASAFLAASDGLLGCQQWSTTVGDRTVTFAATAGAAPADLGEESRRVDLESIGGPDRYYLRILLIRTGDKVLELSYASGIRTDLDALDQLAVVALAEATR